MDYQMKLEDLLRECLRLDQTCQVSMIRRENECDVKTLVFRFDGGAGVEAESIDLLEASDAY